MKLSNALINKLSEKANIEDLLFRIEHELRSGKLNDYGFEREMRTFDAFASYNKLVYADKEKNTVITINITNPKHDFNWVYTGVVENKKANKETKLDKEYLKLHDFIGSLIETLESNK